MAGSSGQVVLLESSDEEWIVLESSDDEQHLVPAAATASRNPRVRGQGAPDRRVTAAATLVKRSCRCKAVDCLTQFRHNVCEIEAARNALHRADPAEQEMQIAWMFCGREHGVQERLQRVVKLAAADAESAPAIMYESDVDKASQGIMHASDSSDDSSSEPESPQRPPRGTKRKYRHRAGGHARSGMFLGLPVCLAALARLLAIGTSVIEKVRHGVTTCHRGKGRLHPKHPLLNISLLRAHSGIVWPTVLSFLWLVYHSSAEGLPTQHVLMRDIRGKNGVRVALQDALAEGSSSGDRGDSDEEVGRCIRKRILDLQAYESDVETFVAGPGTVEGPRRYLQHGRPVHLYWEYEALQRSRCQPTASFTTFLKIFHRVFGQHLRFRKKLQHAECSVCSSLKQLMAAARTIQERQETSQLYLTHIFDQWRDRQIYWTLRSLSVAWFEQSQRLGARRAQSKPQRTGQANLTGQDTT